MLYKLKYLGFVLGVCFPIAALLLDMNLKELNFSLSSIVLLHKLNPLHWIIDFAPLMLGMGSFFAAVRIESQIRMKKVSENRLENTEKLLGYIENLNEGNYDIDITHDDTKHDYESNIVRALAKLKQKLLDNKESEEARNWVNEGYHKISEILMAKDNVQYMYDRLISNIVRYVRANQGGIYQVEGGRIKLVACYAYDRKKFLEKEIEFGQGLIGQAYLEKEFIMLTQVPQNYVTITSGLGEETPSCLLIVPLMLNEEVVVLLEIASFHTFSSTDIEFIEKAGEGIASTVSNINADINTKRLLSETQQLADELSTREEDMSQNVEELQAAQEEMLRREREYKNKIKELTKMYENKLEDEAKHNAQIELKNAEIEEIKEEEKRLLESKLASQKHIYDTIINKLKDKLKKLEPNKTKNYEQQTN